MMSPFYQHHHYCTALPSPPPSYIPKLPYLITSSHSSTASLSSQTHDNSSRNPPHLPSIHHGFTPSSPSNSSTTPDSTPSSPASLSTSFSYTYKSPPSPQQRNRSVLSLLNSDPELKRLDEEEYKCGYQTHFMNDGIKRKQSHSHFCGTAKRLKSSNGKNDQQHGTIPSCATTTATTSLLRLPLLSTTKGGLRHFSKQVCDKVESHGITTYDQIVYEITRDFSTLFPSSYLDQKNIRRRVYDSLNVLRAMDIIAKVKKEIKWLGIPSCCQPDAPNNMDDSENEDLLLSDAGDSLLAQQIHVEEARKKTLLSSLSGARLDLRNSLTRYLQLRRLIYRNQHDPLTALPIMLTDDGDMNYLQTNKTFDSPYQFIEDADILQNQSNHPFTTQELTAWLPDSSWYQYLDLNAS
ncbi:E2F/DP family winged-helix DNA-binding domain-domain-containing protein [Absidia repens]|uniref:E2F/DP family winged-helix DNA-binding domain-domain-containing protein n=1 Tax=Absidia repens TaxID=90262 RepID=A0A1X2IRX5_9FUNG|nr:E2F/DP family winged-helix DNA-binding domain-domain-containing protein [Absidia repens]